MHDYKTSAFEAIQQLWLHYRLVGPDGRWNVMSVEAFYGTTCCRFMTVIQADLFNSRPGVANGSRLSSINAIIVQLRTCITRVDTESPSNDRCSFRHVIV
jgi:hypothetical protein